MSNRRALTILFFILSLLFVWYALWLGGFFLLFLWPALSFLLVGIAYAGLGPSLLAKQSDGSLPLRAYLLLGPYLFLSWLGWLGLKLLQGKEPWHEVAPDIFVGRRLGDGELPDGVAVIVDLTCELATLHQKNSQRKYICIPTLDATAPTQDETLAVIEALRDEEGRIFIHCAAGHGRSATLAAALVVARGLAQTEDDAERLLQQTRRRIKLNAEQKRLLALCVLKFNAP